MFISKKKYNRMENLIDKYLYEAASEKANAEMLKEEVLQSLILLKRYTNIEDIQKVHEHLRNTYIVCGGDEVALSAYVDNIDASRV